MRVFGFEDLFDFLWRSIGFDWALISRPCPIQLSRRPTNLILPLPTLLDLLPKLLLHRLILLQKPHEPTLGRLDLLLLRFILGELVHPLDGILIRGREGTGGCDQLVCFPRGGRVWGGVQSGL